MCGIVGAVALRNITPVLVEGLRRLEYRGYDSSGVAVLDAADDLIRVRRKGKIRELEAGLRETPANGLVGIAHTRWATHGVPSERNAHPHLCRESVAVVHNGIIENHEALRVKLESKGYEFESETDTETIVHQIHEFLEAGLSLREAVRRTSALLNLHLRVARLRLRGPLSTAVHSTAILRLHPSLKANPTSWAWRRPSRFRTTREVPTTHCLFTAG